MNQNSIYSNNILIDECGRVLDEDQLVRMLTNLPPLPNADAVKNPMLALHEMQC